MDNKEKIGFHKGALDCLLKERAEFSRILSIVDALIQMHTKGLSDLGIDIKAELEKAKDASDNNAQHADENFVNLDSAIKDSKKNF